MTPISKKREKDKRSCNQVKGERGKMGSGGPRQGLPKYVLGNPGNMILRVEEEWEGKGGGEGKGKGGTEKMQKSRIQEIAHARYMWPGRR